MGKDTIEEKDENQQNTQAAQSLEQKEVVLMKKGDYTVHVLIEEIKGCKEITADRLPFPVVKVTCFDQSKRTPSLSIGCKDYIFGEHFYFDKTNLTAEMLDSEKIIIEAFDSKNSSKKDFFGIYEFDFEYIYNRPDHVLRNFWLALANPESDNVAEVRGYLKLSISVLQENDPRVELESSEGENTDFLIPAQIKMTYKQVSIHIFRAEQLPDMDSLFSEKKVNRQCDGYVEVKYLGISRSTSVREMEKEVVTWNEIVDIPVSLPAVSSKIVMIVKDHDVGNDDDIVGSIELRIEDILKDQYKELKYVSIYGSPINKSGGIYDQMNYNAEIGSKWKGRILIKVDVLDVDAPAPKVRQIKADDPILPIVNKLSRPNLWSLSIVLYSATFLPDEKKEYGVKVCFEEQTFKAMEKKNKDGVIEWNMTGSLRNQNLSSDFRDLPDVFIYLTQKEQNVCFQRIPAKTFYLNTDFLMVKLIPDPAIGKVSSMMNSGMLKMKICLYNTENKFDEEGFKKIRKTSTINDGDAGGNDDEEDDLEAMVQKQKSGAVEKEEKDLPKYTIAAIVYMSKELIAADSDGTSDPYVVLKCGGQKKQTAIKYNTINGIWNEKLVFTDIPFDIQSQADWPIFFMQVIDKNRVLSDVTIGYNYIWLSNTAHSLNDTALIKPKWHHIFLPKSNKKQGKIMLSFYIFDEKNKGLVDNIQFKPQTIPYSCEINILGLRQLKPLSVFPVKKAFIKFDMNSLNVTGDEKDALQPILTIPGPVGSDPTINTVIKFDAKLPKDDTFIPDLQCEVYDHLLNGVMNSLLGVFTLNVKEIIKKTHEQISEDMKVDKALMGKNLLAHNLFRGKNGSGGGLFAGLLKQSEPKDEEISTDNKESLEEPLIPEKENENEKEKDVEIPVSSPSFPTPGENKSSNELVPPAEITKMCNKKEITPKIIEENLYNSIIFVLYPDIKKFVVPGPQKPELKKEFYIEDESKAPDSSKYFQVGYLIKAEPEMKLSLCPKHYRRFFGMPLENVKELGLKSPFLKASLRRGKFEDVRSETYLFDALKGLNGKILMRFNEKGEKKSREGGEYVPSEDTKLGFMGGSESVKTFGDFKGLIRICEKKRYDDYQKAVQNSIDTEKTLLNKEHVKTSFKNLNKYEELRKKILGKRNVIIRVYVLELNNLAKKDLLSESDPYIKIFLAGKEVVNEQKNHQDDQKNCKWYKVYDLPSEIPGSGSLKLQVWDYDDLVSDDLIGETVIDLEDRYFDSTWQELVHKPIEVRPLIHPDISGSQGEVYMWLEIFDANQRSEKPPLNISPEPITPMEMRFVVWETEGMECMDVEGTSDIYVIGYIDMKEKQSTDIHYRCQTGAGSFNWRMLLPINSPKSPNVLSIQVYDNDIFGTNDYICGAQMNIKSLVAIPKFLDLNIKFTRDYYESLSPEEKKPFGEIEFMSKEDDPEGIKFWIQCYKNNVKGGRVLCTIEILPQWKADMNKVGKGRDEPNLDPYLPPPTGRFEFSLNPFKMFNQCVGPKFRRKCYCYICTGIILAYLICVLPYLLAQTLLNKMVGIK